MRRSRSGFCTGFAASSMASRRAIDGSLALDAAPVAIHDVPRDIMAPPPMAVDGTPAPQMDVALASVGLMSDPHSLSTWRRPPTLMRVWMCSSVLLFFRSIS